MLPDEEEGKRKAAAWKAAANLASIENEPF